jgi:hypothetical protein
MIEPGHISLMKINSTESIELADKVFRRYGGSWTAAREAAYRDEDGVLVIPKNPEVQTPVAHSENADPQGDREAG